MLAFLLFGVEKPASRSNSLLRSNINGITMSILRNSHAPAETEFMKEHRESPFGRLSHAALLFCILFAFLAPSLLIWQVLL